MPQLFYKCVRKFVKILDMRPDVVLSQNANFFVVRFTAVQHWQRANDSYVGLCMRATVVGGQDITKSLRSAPETHRRMPGWEPARSFRASRDETPPPWISAYEKASPRPPRSITNVRYLKQPSVHDRAIRACRHVPTENGACCDPKSVMLKFCLGP